MIKNILISAMSAVMLTACGGGGGSSSPTPEPSPPTPIVNTAPQVSDAVIVDSNGGSVKAGDVLAFSYTYSDTENDVEGASRIEWFSNNEVIESASAAEYTVLANQEGQRITARITPIALTGKIEGIASNSNALTVAISPPAPIANTAPKVSGAVIVDSNGGLVKAGDVLAFSYTYSDAENDAEGASRIEWLLNNEVIALAFAAEYTVLANQEGQQITARIFPVALTGEIEGVASNSNALTVAIDGAPVVENIRIKNSQKRFKPGAVLTASYDYSDAENDVEGESTFRWLRNGEAIMAAAALEYTLVAADEGQKLEFEVTPKALTGKLQGPEFLSASIQIEANTAPIVTAATIEDVNEGDVRKGDRLNASYTYSDEENNAEGESTFRWFRGKIIISDATSNFYILRTEDEGQDIRYEITPIAESGLVQGNTVRSTPITAAVNQAPSVSNVKIIDKNGGIVRPGDQLEVTWDYHDADSDEEGDTTIGWQYFRPNGSGGIPGSNGRKTYTVGAYYGQKIQAIITPVAKTGEANGTHVRSQKVSVSSRPTSSNHQVFDLNGGDVEVGDILEARYTFVDVDGDLEDESGVQVTWIRSGHSSPVARGANKRYIVVADDAGQTLRFNVSVLSDAGEQSYVYGSPAVQVADAVIPAFVFTREGDMKALVGTAYTNIASGPGNGAITYTSSDDELISVSDSGVASPKKTGAATITATMAADGDFPEKVINYDVEIREASYSLSGWIGTDKTAITLAGNLTDITLHSSSQADCDVTDPRGCEDYQSQSLEDYSAAPSSIDRTAGTLNRPGYYLSRYGDYAAKTVLASQSRFDSSVGAQFVEFKGKLWKLGGGKYASDANNEIWNTDDGHYWVKVKTDENSVFTPRFNHQVQEFKGRLWITGGKGVVNGRLIDLQDVWSSLDGINWVEEAETAFGPFSNHSMSVANDKLWIAGGDTTNGQQKIYSSVDGISWLEAGNLSFGGNGRYLDLATVPGVDGAADILLAHAWGKVYQFGSDGQFTLVASDLGTGPFAKFGYRDEQLLLIDTSRPLVKSRNVDGTWNTDASTGFIRSVNHGVVNFNGSTWVIGAGSRSPKTSQWAQRTQDGTHWITEFDNAAFAPRYNSALVSTGDTLMMVGGVAGGQYTAESWESIDGIDWSHKPVTNQLGRGNTYSAIMFNDELYASQNKDVFRLGDDGWQSVATFAEMQFNQLVVHNEKLYLIAGAKTGNKVYVSSDGDSWTDTSFTGAPFTANSYFSVVSFDNKLWVIAGRYFRSQQKIWSSADGGVTWFERQAPFEARYSQRVVVYKNAMWLFGGQSSGATYYNDVYRSIDGTSWQKQTDNMNVPIRQNAAMTVHNDRLYRIGGYRSDGRKSFNDVWSSDDGITWQKAFKAIVNFDPIPLVNRD